MAGLVIAHVADSMERGGAEVLIAELCRLQRREGHLPSVHCLFRKGILGEELEAEGFPVVLHGPGSRLTLMRRLKRSFAAARTSVVHCHNATATIIAALPARLAGARAVISTRHGLIPPPYGWRREVQFSLAARFCNWVVAVCDTAQRNLRGAPLAGLQNITTIYNGAQPRNDSIPAQPYPEKKGFTIINVGRLAPAKDQKVLLQALAIVRRIAPDIFLWIVGGGMEEIALHNLAEDLHLEENVTFFGERSDIGVLLSKSDLFVLSSNSEGLPVSLLEAMAAGLPVIVTEVGGMPEIVRPSGAGSIVPPSNPEALASAILDYAQRPDELPRIGQAGRRYYEQHFTLERMAADYMLLYRKCLGA